MQPDKSPKPATEQPQPWPDGWAVLTNSTVASVKGSTVTTVAYIASNHKRKRFASILGIFLLCTIGLLVGVALGEVPYWGPLMMLGPLIGAAPEISKNLPYTVNGQVHIQGRPSWAIAASAVRADLEMRLHGGLAREESGHPPKTP